MFRVITNIKLPAVNPQLSLNYRNQGSLGRVGEQVPFATGGDGEALGGRREPWERAEEEEGPGGAALHISQGKVGIAHQSGRPVGASAFLPGNRVWVL